jgi:resuscitation-promoting factor RpfA
MADSDDELRRLYGTLPREKPPAALDAAVLAASRRAVAPRSLARRWGIPLSVAAAAVLAIGLALQMQGHDTAGRSAPASMPAQRAAPAEKAAGGTRPQKAKREAPGSAAPPP